MVGHVMLVVRVEPKTAGMTVQCAIHWATEATSFQEVNSTKGVWDDEKWFIE